MTPTRTLSMAEDGLADSAVDDRESTEPSSRSPRLSLYQTSLEMVETEQEELETTQNRLSNLRLLAAALSVIGFLLAVILDAPVVPLVLAIVAALAFVALVVIYRKRARELVRVQMRSAYLRDALARLERDWSNLPLRHDAVAAPDHPYSGDLDILGYGSVMHLIDEVSTSVGEQTLLSWLLSPAPVEELRQRQPAISELADQPDWREEFAVLGRLGAQDRPDPAAFLEWAAGPVTLHTRPLLIWIARLGFLATIVAVVLAIAGVIPAAFITIPLILNLVFSMATQGIVGDAISLAAQESRSIGAYASMVQHLESTNYVSPLLQERVATLSSDSADPAHAEIGRLDRITSFAVPKGSLSYLPLQALANWDLQVLWTLEKWQMRNGKHVSGWIETIGQFEALSSLAHLTYDNPDWATPTVAENVGAFDATALGHPLIPDAARVVNDVVMGPSGSVLLITGSNMSGKSTMLRSIGVNMVLAQAGTSTCARAVTMPPSELWTSVRVSDSLEQGISYYMAELLRLKQVHGAAEKAYAEHRPFAYLLDEILHGTNTGERQIAARHIIASLIRLDAIGAVSTHDLSLADSGDLKRLATLVHFSDQVSEKDGRPEMTFDYVLKPGLATSTNALRLMEIVGFTMPAENGRATKPTAEAVPNAP